ncbi:UPF0042 nucleotide-binding protein [Endobacter medicaginis]|uniref:UPF0042 nucleotide-binding protein n=2 Tax=Endobacter medicaginis TaxID=1181271 RepID=A0A839UX35_9PROT|nr:RNase adapter RapZ [Endobacter medicaginis]MBB3174898.1 UPF0042 nucleotide-binding protein [Endobacter medicaginis]MCX5475861.1 RNase adapter RapZ [Endobacter medicaginis]
MSAPAPERHLLLVTGQSGAGKSSVLRILEDLGYAAMDNPPLDLVPDIVAAERYATDRLALGIDIRSLGFDAARLLELRRRLDSQQLAVELLFLAAEDEMLLRRFTATRRRHPLAGESAVPDKLAAEAVLLAPVRAAADTVIDTTDLRAPELRRAIEARYGARTHGIGGEGLAVTLMSFAFPSGLPREADMVFDARFLRNPFYEASLAARDGRDAAVAAYVAADPDYLRFRDSIAGMLSMVLPRFVGEGKKYATIAIGCSGGRHRSVTLVEALAAWLRDTPGLVADGPVLVRHRELDAAPLVPRRGEPMSGTRDTHLGV